MSVYRPSRNIEASTIEYIDHILDENDYTDVQVEKTFSRIYTIELPSICVRVGDTEHTKAELGSNTTIRKPLILIDIFATSDGQRLDLKDLLIDQLKSGWDYVEFVIVDGAVESRSRNGRIQVIGMSDTIIDLGVEKSSLDVRDRYRHLISLNCQISKLED